MWENLEVGWRERARRQLKSTAITLLISVVSTVVITAIDVVNGLGIIDYEDITCSESSGLADLICRGLFYLLVMLPIIAGNVALFLTTPVLATRIERHHTISGMENAMLLKMTFFQASTRRLG